MKRLGLLATLMVCTTITQLDLDDYWLNAPSSAQSLVDDDDDSVRKELKHRKEFQENYQKAFSAILVLVDEFGAAETRELIEWVAGRVTMVRARWQAFDKKHPEIYATAEAKRRAYDQLDPNKWFRPENN
jgi:hypothetical protein